MQRCPPRLRPNEADDIIIDKMGEVRELRQRLKEMRDDEMIVQKDKSSAELELAQRTNSFLSPVPVTNLMANINAAAQMDAQQITTLVTMLVSAMKSELLSQMEARLLTVLQQHSTQQSTTSPSLSAAPS